jgi:hypothetical protein
LQLSVQDVTQIIFEGDSSDSNSDFNDENDSKQNCELRRVKLIEMFLNISSDEIEDISSVFTQVRAWHFHNSPHEFTFSTSNLFRLIKILLAISDKRKLQFN